MRGEVGRFIREQRRNAQISLRRLAKIAGISNPYLSQIERGLRKPSAEILQAIARALRISAETLYVKAGILEERDGGKDLVREILEDPFLKEKQKEVLIEIYRAFRRQNRAEMPLGAVPASGVRRRRRETGGAPAVEPEEGGPAVGSPEGGMGGSAAESDRAAGG